MPELPEVETLLQGLSPLVLGRRIERVEALRDRTVRKIASFEEFEASVVSTQVVALRRYAKHLIVDLARNHEFIGHLILHMGMSGQLRSSGLTGEESVYVRHSNFRVHLDDGTIVAFIDPRTFGWIAFDSYDGDPMPISLRRLGPDAILSSDPLALIKARATSSSIGIKWQLLDQALIGGIGNMYGDEILFDAAIAPFRTPSTFSEEEFITLITSIRKILTRAIELRGSSLFDRTYRDIAGEIGAAQKFHMAYAREGEPCLRCGDQIVRVVSKGRSSFFCRICQI
ncbi:DNA-formamidopyrimidine glycosylase [Acidithrix ferrooxidans]|uniref:Formamidopyrimidine-DNA glycosylase n=1 Tax=Acidithrix ferrooxidans TaxID=1280514 RepID=A0A0D8HDC9_9ACTN|nr:DNA-formamidopyrimidine glycosylase [Acidithrix ferrooxidans]KJF15955.1 formamidopyrimidine-DNA glycosylase [Acidithrix ferrooxidans]